MVMGSARKVRLTKPPRVAAPQARKKRTKKAMPRATRAVLPTGTRGVSIDPGRSRSVPPSLDEARVDGGGDVGHALDDAELEEQLSRFLAEGLQLTVEELLVRLPILPAQVGLRLLELLARLLHYRSHDLEALLGLLGDHVHRLEVAVDHGLHERGMLRDELGRAAEGVHDHGIVQRGGDDLPRLRLLPHRR